MDRAGRDLPFVHQRTCPSSQSSCCVSLEHILWIFSPIPLQNFTNSPPQNFLGQWVTFNSHKLLTTQILSITLATKKTAFPPFGSFWCIKIRWINFLLNALLLFRESFFHPNVAVFSCLTRAHGGKISRDRKFHGKLVKGIGQDFHSAKNISQNRAKRSFTRCLTLIGARRSEYLGGNFHSSTDTRFSTEISPVPKFSLAFFHTQNKSPRKGIVSGLGKAPEKIITEKKSCRSRKL